ncbi:hypothetical protein ACJX0J_026582, partial [Zea mays]
LGKKHVRIHWFIVAADTFISLGIRDFTKIKLQKEQSNISLYPSENSQWLT